MSTKQSNTHDGSTDSTTILDNLVNANSVNEVYVYRDGDQLAIETPVQRAEFSLDQLSWVFESEADVDVFELVFESRGTIHDLYWMPGGQFDCIVSDLSGQRHFIRFTVTVGDSDA